MDTARFYDALRTGGLSSAALAFGDRYIGQECLLTADEIETFARRAGIAAGTSVLDIGSGTGGPACYLARELGCRVRLYRGEAAALTRPRAGGRDPWPREPAHRTMVTSGEPR